MNSNKAKKKREQREIRDSFKESRLKNGKTVIAGRFIPQPNGTLRDMTLNIEAAKSKIRKQLKEEARANILASSQDTSTDV